MPPNPPVTGTSSDPNVAGVTGDNTAWVITGGHVTGGPGVSGSSVGNDGVHGESQFVQGAGVSGVNHATGLELITAFEPCPPFGVRGDSTEGDGVCGTSANGAGVRGVSGANDPGAETVGLAGVVGINNGTGPGVIGRSTSGAAVHGTSGSGAGVQATSSSGVALQATSNSGNAISASSTGDTDAIITTTSAASPWAAVHGRNNGDGFGVFGSSNTGHGIVGVTSGDELLAEAMPFGPSGVAGGNITGSGVSAMGNPAVYAFGIGTPPNANAIMALGTVNALGGTGELAIFVIGKVGILGDLQVTGGSKAFCIDHPLDPAHRYLRHAAVESSELKTVYDGIAELDANGAAVITLPEWFSELNGDLRYELTAIGAPAPNLHVTEDSDGKTLKVAGGVPKQRISWQITGVRRDRSALASPLVVEEEKAGDERGRYLEPHLFGAGTAMAIHADLYDMAKDAETKREEIRQRLNRT